MKEKLNNLKNSTGILSILMILSLFLPWYEPWYNSSTTPTPNAFEIVTVNKMTLLIIVLVFIIFVTCIVVSDIYKKQKIIGGLSIAVLLFNIIARFQLVKLPSASSHMTYKGTRFGWVIITLLSLLQIL